QEAADKDTDRIVGEYEPGAIVEDSDASFHLRFLAAFWRLCDQRIAEHDAAPLTHSAKVAAQHTGAPPDVRVVQVRSPEQPAQRAAGDNDKTWQHRWIVRMHKVRQWYPSL